MADLAMKERAFRIVATSCAFALIATAAGAQTPYSSAPSHRVGPEQFSSADWGAIRSARDAALADYIAKKQVAWRWFADFPFGTTKGAPYVIVKLLPKLAPQEWGSEGNFLDSVGLFIDEREPGLPIARGFGWTGLARDDPFGAVDHAAITCGSCHIGRVRLDDGRYRYIDGGVNTQFNLVQYRVRVVNTIKAITAGAATPEERTARATEAVLAALDKAHAEDKNFFYSDYAFGSRKFDAAYEEKQIELFKQNASELVKEFLDRSEKELGSLVELLAQNYKGFETQMVAGFGGMADATGVSSSIAFVDRGGDRDKVLPPAPGITDFMAVWEQGKRRAHWNADKTELVDGGGQWNGNIPIPIFRNLAAETTLGLGADTDLRIGAFAVDLLDGLPAPAYPFVVDMALAKKGEALFAENCAVCHKPHNGKVYDMGTDLSRAHVVSPSIAESARRVFTALCPPAREIVLPTVGPQKPCAEFDGVSLDGKPQLAMRDPVTREGYDALPLGGIWAQAPYLHNGSVPTLYHLLVPNERPTVFTKGRLDYDRKHGGFSWEPGASGAKEEGYRFDTAAFRALSNKGHDQDVVEDGKMRRLDWSGDRDGAMAILGYLKTL